MDQNTEERIRKIIADELGVDDVNPAARLEEDLCADSLDVIETVISIEEEFDIVIPDADVDGLKTVQDLFDYVNGKVLSKGLL